MASDYESKLCSCEHALERGARRIHFIRKAAFASIVTTIIVFRLIPSFWVIVLMLVVIVLCWICEVENIRKEARAYKCFVNLIAEEFKHPVQVRTPKCRSRIKTMMCSIDVTPFYIGILIFTLIIWLTMPYGEYAKKFENCVSRSDSRVQRVLLVQDIARSRVSSAKKWFSSFAANVRRCHECSILCLFNRNCSCDKTRKTDVRNDDQENNKVQ